MSLRSIGKLTKNGLSLKENDIFMFHQIMSSFFIFLSLICERLKSMELVIIDKLKGLNESNRQEQSLLLW